MSIHDSYGIRLTLITLATWSAQNHGMTRMPGIPHALRSHNKQAGRWQSRNKSRYDYCRDSIDAKENKENQTNSFGLVNRPGAPSRHQYNTALPIRFFDPPSNPCRIACPAFLATSSSPPASISAAKAADCGISKSARFDHDKLFIISRQTCIYHAFSCMTF